MPVTNYHTVNGSLRGETTSGARTNYLTDALGSVTATVNSGGAVVNTYRHKPYGGLLAKTGASPDPHFLWTGATGSRRSLLIYTEQYNRARHLNVKTAAWISTDPLWPEQPNYLYAQSDTISIVDPLGLLPSHYTKIFLTQPACAGLRSEWEIVDKTGSKRPLYLKQLVVVKATCYDCDTKAKCTERQIDVRALELFPFSKENGSGTQFVNDEWSGWLGRRAGGRTYACTSGTMTFHATYDILFGVAYPPPTPPWSRLTRKAGENTVAVGFHINPYKGSWRGKYERKLTYEWDCCVDPIWYKFAATDSAMSPVVIEPKPKSKKRRRCPGTGGVGNQE